MTPDRELLRQYVQAGSEQAFAELVRRHVNLVYSAALRQVAGDAHLAHDVSQNVFTDLARRAHSLLRRDSLTGWLYTSTHFAAGKIVRTESRRRQREEHFMREPVPESAAEADWEKLRPALDALMHELKETDREAVLLRYFENRGFAEVGAKLGVNENAARMRVERALEKLRDLLGKRGITTAVALASIISANAVQIAPSGTATALTAVSLAAAGTGTIAKIMTITKLKLVLGSLAVAGMATAVLIQHHTLTALLLENDSLRSRTGQIQIDNGQASNPPTTDTTRKLSTDEFNELLRLRAKVTQLQAAKTLATAALELSTNDLAAPSKTHILLKVKFVSLTADGVQSLRPTWAAPVSGFGVLSGEQFKRVNETMQGRDDVRVVSSPRIQTSSGVPASLSSSEPVSIDGTNVPIGITLDVAPYFSPESSLFDLKVTARMTQLTGDSTRLGVQTIQASNQVTLALNQTAVFQKEIPAGGWTPDSTNTPDGPRTLIVFVSPEVVDPNHQAQVSERATVTETQVQRINNARQGVLALVMFAEDHDQQYPTNSAQLSQYFKGDSWEHMETNFDFLWPASTANITNYPETIVIREKRAWQTSDGKWAKAYAFADGHAEIHSDPKGNFDDYEKDRIIVSLPLNE